MANSLRILPDPLEVGQGFIVKLRIDAAEANQGDKYMLVITDPSAPVVIDIHTDEITTKSGHSAVLTFESVDGFQAIGHFTFFAVNESDPLKPIPGTQLEFDVDLPAPIPTPAPAPTPPAPPVVPPVVPTPAVATPAASTTTAPSTSSSTSPSAWRFMSHGVSWVTAFVVVLAALVIGIGILFMPAWAIWLIAKNGNSQNVQPISASSSGQTINPTCKVGCSAVGNLYFPRQ